LPINCWSGSSNSRAPSFPKGINVTVTRNYGVTANDKAMTLITKLIFATSLVIGLVLIALGWREAFIVGAAVILTLTITLFASWAWGFTLNRVSLFALIFSIGILVDDAIVVVENIHRHIHLGGRKLVEAIPLAVDEVGGPTILATFTVIAALLPMAFVSGLDGAVHESDPDQLQHGNADLAGGGVRVHAVADLQGAATGGGENAAATVSPPPARESHPCGRKRGKGREDFSHRLFRRVVGPFLRGRQRQAAALGAGRRRTAADRRFGQLGLFPTGRAENAALRQ
jgi:hypothetical protein